VEARAVGNCYGTENAPRVWFDTLIPKLGELKFQQSEVDPCFWYKVYADGSRFDLGLYVDDVWACDDAGSLADADWEQLGVDFQFTVQEDPKQFLNMNVTVLSDHSVKFSMEAYVLRMADTYVPDWRSWPVLERPATEELQRDYEEAHGERGAASAEMLKQFRAKTGAMIYTSPCVRPDACYAISRLSRAQTFPTEKMDKHADRVIVYLAQTAHRGVVFDGSAPEAATLRAESDSDWAVGHSTTGWAIFLAGAAVIFSSKRQPCIAMSSTEAEIIAASSCALQLIFAIRLARELGMAPDGPVVLRVDNAGAVELARDRKSCHRSRHVDRRYFKVRELVAEGLLRVEHVNTKENSSDILTKVIDVAAHNKHTATLLNDNV
jgi:hypothetical protein